ncbi:MAG: hypothetical protein JWN96_2314 [Mycobacterium sp.]|nr:hypothetical protein [Mycobacterium sp.]
MKRSAGESGVSGAGAPGRVARLGPRWAVPVVLLPVGLALVGGDAAGRGWLAAAVILVQAALGVAWLLLLSASIDAAVLVGFAVAAADIVLLRTDLSTGGSISGVIGLSVVAVLLHQLAVRNRRAVTANVAINLSAIVAGCAPALLIPLRELCGGRSVIYVSVISAIAAVVMSRLLGGGDVIGVVGCLVVAAAVSLGFGLPSGGLGTGDALGAGLSSAVAALLIDRALVRVSVPEQDRRSRRSYVQVTIVVSALLPIALAAPIAYLAGRIIAPGCG